jgi:hypothetical protein
MVRAEHLSWSKLFNAIIPLYGLLPLVLGRREPEDVVQVLAAGDDIPV